MGRPVTHRKGRGWRGGFLGSAIEQYIKLDLNKWLRVLRHLELLPRPLGQDWSEIWLQKFSGTVTLWPKTVPSDFFHILSDPTPDRLARMIHVGQQSAFPKLQFIKNRLNIENAIMRGLQQCSTTGGRSLSPILSRRMQAPELEPADALSQRLDASFPERHEDGGSRYVDVSDSMSQSTASASSRPQTPTRRASLMEEVRRQSAVFFDDADIYGDGDAIIT